MKAIGTLIAALTLSVATLAPTIAPAQSLGDLIKRRGQKESEWRKIGYGSAAVGLIGILTKNNTLTYAGVGGGLYSYYRYEQDRKSRKASERQRASFYGSPYRTYQGKKYKRVTTKRGGKRYYSYVRA